MTTLQRAIGRLQCRTARKCCEHGARHFFRFGNAAGTDFAAGLFATARPDDPQAAAAQRGHVGLGCRVRPHQAIHRRRHEDRSVGGQHQRGQQIVGKAMRDLGQRIGSGRRDDDGVRPARQLDVAHRRFSGLIPQRRTHRLAGQRLEGLCTDEAQRGFGHHHLHVAALLDEAARQFGGLVGSDAARQRQQDAWPCIRVRNHVRRGRTGVKDVT